MAGARQRGIRMTRGRALALFVFLGIAMLLPLQGLAAETGGPEAASDAGELYMREMEERYKSESGSTESEFTGRSCMNIREFLSGVSSGRAMTLKVVSGRLPGLSESTAPENRVRVFYTQGDGMIRFEGRTITSEEFKDLSGMAQKCKGRPE